MYDFAWGFSDVTTWDLNAKDPWRHFQNAISNAYNIWFHCMWMMSSCIAWIIWYHCMESLISVEWDVWLSPMLWNHIFEFEIRYAMPWNQTSYTMTRCQQKTHAIKSDKIISKEWNQKSDIFTGTEIIKSNATKSYNPLNDQISPCIKWYITCI